MRAFKFGFTLIELLVALTIVALLLSIVVPRYFGGLSSAEEAVLKENLYLIRDALEKYHADRGRYPDSLNQLVTNKYLRSVPQDPMVRSSSAWIIVPPVDPKEGGVYDVRSSAPGFSRSGKRYEEW